MNEELSKVRVYSEDKKIFAAGGDPGPGRPKGSVGGRALALQTLDKVWALERNQENFANAMQAAIDENPLRVFRQYIMPLLPTNLRLELAQQGATPWGNLQTTCRMMLNSSSMPAIDVSESSSPADASAKRFALPPT